ncbi:MAG: Aureobasidin resistance protein Aur1 [Geoglossum simile]|nr:MAG: Aureobasidin resistance protein Aur1 [Geoglossum simile]
MYTSTFTASPLALFMSHAFPKLRPLFIAYVLWIWWATLYLSHHYAVDLVAGSLLAGIVFYVAKAKFLVRLQPDKDFRWDYDYTEVGDAPSGYGMADFDADFHTNSDNDDWTVGSSSSVSSGCISPVDENGSLWEGETLASHSDSDAIELVIEVPR